MPKKMSPLVVDLSHHNDVEDWSKVYASGIRGVIHKATQGTGMVDATYTARKKAAKASGLLWGAYHFGDNSDVAKQVENFLSTVKPDGSTLLCLDWEPNGRRTMSKDQAKEFLRLVREKTGQRPLLYSGNLVKEQIGKAADTFLSEHRLWLAQYGPRPVLPAGWSTYWLWQYTGDGVGNEPHEIDGIKTKGIDLNVFGGKSLEAEWVDIPEAQSVAETVQTPPAAPTVTAKDLAPLSRKMSLIVRLRNWAASLGIGGAGLSLADLKEQAGPLHDLAQMFRDHAFLLLIGGCLVGVVIASVLISWIVSDHNEGRYVPSRAMGG